MVNAVKRALWWPASWGRRGRITCWSPYWQRGCASHCVMWIWKRTTENVRVGVLLAVQQNLICLCLFIYCWPNILTFTKPSKLSKFPLLELSPYWTFLSQLSSRCTHPHPFLTRHAHTPVTLSSSVRNPDCLATVLFIHISSSTEGAISIQTHVISWQMLAFCVNIPCTGTG